MANTIITPQVIAEEGLATLYEQTQMLPNVFTDLSSEFSGQKQGNTVNVKRPPTYTAAVFDRAVGIVPQNAVETTIPVVLDKLLDVSIEVTSEELTLSINDFNALFLNPAMEALSQAVDRALIATARADFTQVAGTGTGTEWSKPEALIEAGRILNVNKVPPTNRVAIIGPSTHAQWLNNDILKRADASGDTEALRNASIGSNLFSFATYWSQNIAQPKATGSQVSGDPTTEVGLAFHKTALAFVSTPQEIPPGSNAVNVSYKGLNLRVAYAWDIKFKKTIVSIDVLFGTKTIDANRGVLLRGALKP